MIAARPVQSTLPRLLVRLAVVTIACAFTRSSFADTRSFALSWPPSSEDTCIKRSELEHAVAAWLGRNPFVPGERADFVLEGRGLTPAGGRIRARIEERDREGHVIGVRELEAKTCEELKRKAAFVVILIVAPEAAFGRPAPPPEPEEKEPEPVVDTPRPERPPAPQERKRLPVPRERKRSPASRRPHRPIGDVGAAVAFSTGLLPGLAMGPAVTVGLAPLPVPLRFEWQGAYRRSLSDTYTGAFHALEQQWRVCAVGRASSALSGTACAGAAWAAIVPSPYPFRNGDRGAKSAGGPVLALGPALRLGPLDAFADISLMFPRPNYVFVYRDGQRQPRTLYEVDATVVTVAVGIRRTF